MILTEETVLLVGLSIATLGYFVLVYLMVEMWLIMRRRRKNDIGTILVETLLIVMLLLFSLLAISLYKEIFNLASLPAEVRWILLGLFTIFPWLTVRRFLSWRRENKQ